MFKKTLITSTLLLTCLGFSVAVASPVTSEQSNVKTTFSKEHRSHGEAHREVAVKGKINMNSADAKTLSELKGIGLKKAEAIVKYRQEHGDFKSLDELTAIRGISTKLVDDNKAHMEL